MKKFLMIALSIASVALMGVDSASAASGAACVCGSHGVAAASRPSAPVAATAQAPVQNRRSFSIEPGPAPVYRTPAVRSYRRSGPLNPALDAGRKIRGDF